MSIMKINVTVDSIIAINDKVLARVKNSLILSSCQVDAGRRLIGYSLTFFLAFLAALARSIEKS